jgi:hypothetical protein
MVIMAEQTREGGIKLMAISFYITVFIGTFFGLVLVIENAMLNTLVSIILLLVGINGMYQFLGFIGAERDERSARIGMMAMSISWTCVLVTISLLLILEGLTKIEIGGYRILGMAIMVMMLSLVLSNAYIQRHGHVE